MNVIETSRLSWWRDASAASERQGGPPMPFGPACAALDAGMSPDAAGRAYAAQQAAKAPA